MIEKTTDTEPAASHLRARSFRGSANPVAPWQAHHGCGERCNPEHPVRKQHQDPYCAGPFQFAAAYSSRYASISPPPVRTRDASTVPGSRYLYDYHSLSFR